MDASGNYFRWINIVQLNQSHQEKL
jgi:hypothetical protein